MFREQPAAGEDRRSGGGEEKGIGFRVLLDALGSFVLPSDYFLLSLKQVQSPNPSVPALSLKPISLGFLACQSYLVTLNPSHPQPSHLVHSATFFLCRRFLSSCIVHQMVPTGCERVREMDFQVLLKVEGFVIKDLVFSV